MASLVLLIIMLFMPRMSPPSFDPCPLCVKAITRIVILTLPAITSDWRITDGKLDVSVLTRCVNIGEGKYEKVAGRGDTLRIIDRERIGDD